MATSIRSRSRAPAAWRRRQSDARWSVDWLGTAGWIEKGLLYLGLAGVALLVAFTGSTAVDDVANGHGALLTVALRSTGNLLLALVTFGLFAFAGYRLVTIAFDDTEGPERLRRAGVRVASAAVYLVVGIQGVALLVAADAVADGNAPPTSWTSSLLQTASGKVPLIIVALGLFAFAGFQLYIGFSKRFMENLDCPAGSASSETGVVFVGLIGIVARALVAGLVALFVLDAVAQSGSVAGEGLDASLRELQQSGLGPALLALVSAALAAYGLYCLISARWRRHADG